MKFSVVAVFSLALAIRLAIVFVTSFRETLGAVKYTDIDYEVFSDASKFVWQGGSPYERSTFRYTPLL